MDAKQEPVITHREILERNLFGLWAAIRDTLVALEQESPTRLPLAGEAVPLLRALALDATRLGKTLSERLEADTVEETKPDLPPRRPTVLMVDDDAPALTALVQLFEDEFELLVTTSPSEAAQLVKERAIDALVTDLRMPGMDGISLLQLVQTFCGETAPPCLIMTGHADPTERIKALELGAFDFLIKPLDTEELAARLRRAVRHGRALRRERSLQETDDLTGIANRRAFRMKLQDALRHAMSAGQPLALALIDQDGLKRINDTYGHGAGDASIIAVADALTRTRRSADIPARVGGDEFALVMPNTTQEGAIRALERLEHELRRSPVTLASGVVLNVGVSYGIALRDGTSAEAEDIDQLIAAADEALYVMKRQRYTGQRKSAATRDQAHRAVEAAPNEDV